MAESKPSLFLVFLGSVVCTITVCLPSWACGDFKLMQVKVCVGPFWTCENLQGKCSLNSELKDQGYMYDPEIAFKRAFAHFSVIIYFFASPALLATVILISRARSCLPCLATLSYLVGFFGLLVFVVCCNDYFQDQLQPSLASWLWSWVVTISFQPAFYFFGAGSALLLLVAQDSCDGERKSSLQNTTVAPESEDEDYYRALREIPRTPPTPPTPQTPQIPPYNVEAMRRADLTVARDRQNPTTAATPTEPGHFICPDCQRPCRSNLGLRSHMRVHST